MSSRPDAPPGFEWKRFSDLLILKPIAWHEREKVTNNTIPAHELYAASPEHFSETAPFETGLTIQIMRDIDRLGVDAAEMARVQLSPIFDGRPPEQILMCDARPIGDVERFIVRYLDSPAGVRPIILHKFLVASSTTGVLHMFTFECPQANWDENWTFYGTPILGNICFIHDAPANEPMY